MLASLLVSREDVCVCVCVCVHARARIYVKKMSLLLNTLYFISWQDSKMRTFEGNQDLHAEKRVMQKK